MLWEPSLNELIKHRGQVNPKGKEIRHTEQCALWAELFKLICPEAKVVRDLALMRELKQKDDYTPDRFDLDLVPDIFLEFDARPGSEKLLLGIEIERTQKSKGRIAEKLRKLATRTQFDGVLYISQNPTVLANVRKIYLELEMKKIRRIGHYANGFCLFYLGTTNGLTSFTCHTANEIEVPFRFWIDALKAAPFHSRRGSQLIFPASVRWKMDDEF